MYKIIGADQKEYGPITADQLRQWISEGRINAHTKVQPEGATVWKTVAELPEFAAALPPSAPPMPGTPGYIAIAPPAATTSQLAIWAMITGILSLLCCPVLGPLPIVLGIVALSQIKHHPQQAGAGFAITGIVLGVLSLIMAAVAIMILVSCPQYLTNFQYLANSFPQ
jgi:thiol:disulfide interchange protein